MNRPTTLKQLVYGAIAKRACLISEIHASTQGGEYRIRSALSTARCQGHAVCYYPGHETIRRGARPAHWKLTPLGVAELERMRAARRKVPRAQQGAVSKDEKERIRIQRELHIRRQQIMGVPQATIDEPLPIGFGIVSR